VETFSATLGKILPSGKFGKSSSFRAVFWNFYPLAAIKGVEILTNWKNNSKDGFRRGRFPRRNWAGVHEI
jgi:hypothetical protein